MRAFNNDGERFNTNYYGMNYPDNNRNNNNYMGQSGNYGHSSFRRPSPGITNPRGSWLTPGHNSNNNMRGPEAYNGTQISHTIYQHSYYNR